MSSDVKSKLNIYYQNVRGLRTKTLEIYESVLGEDYDLIALTETWLEPGIDNCELFDSRYEVYRKDRDQVGTGMRRGGGVLLAVHKRLSAVRLDQLILADDVDSLWVRLSPQMPARSSVFINLLYIPPGHSSQLYTDYCNSFDNLNINCNNIIVLGDFNIPRINGTDFDFSTARSSAAVINNFLCEYNLASLNNIRNFDNFTLDLVFSNISDLKVEKDETSLLPCDSYHPPLLITFALPYSNFKTPNAYIPKKYYVFKNANFLDLYCNLRAIDWADLYNVTCVDTCLELFYNKFYSCLDRCVPQKNFVKKSKFPVWFTPDIISDIKLKNKCAKKRKYSRHHDDLFKHLRKQIKQNVKVAFRRYICSVENCIKYDSNSFWNYVKSRNSKSSFDPTSLNDMTCMGNNYNNKQIPNAFANYFSSVYDNFSSNYQLNSRTLSYENFQISLVSPLDVRNAIKELKSKRSSGPDGIPAYIIKGCGEVLSEPLCFIFNLSLSTRVFPYRWKEAKVTPIFKSGDKTKIENYRPISLINSFAKVYELLLYKQMFNAIKSKICPEQHGFLPRRSTVTNLMEFSFNVSSELDNGGRLDVIYTDFSKAFDKVNHDILLDKLLKLGFSIDSCILLTSYLKDRPQYVSVSNVNSIVYFSSSGVPQGSNLGPLLFLIFINDLPSCLSGCKCLLFADDLKIFRPIKFSSDTQALQSAINQLQHWCISNKLHLNVQKCFAMSYSRKKVSIENCYFIGNTPLKSVNTIKDLGIIFDTSLSFSSHIRSLLSESYKLLGFVKRNTRSFQNLEAIMKLYQTLIRSKLEYCCVVWDSIPMSDSDSLEILQNKFLRYLYFKKFSHACPFDLPSSDLRNIFEISKLSLRRKLSLVALVHKIINCSVDSRVLLENICLYVPNRNIRSFNLFSLPRCRTSAHFSFPLFTALRLVNRYPLDVDVFNDRLNVFLVKCSNLFVSD
jgi:hypothetical protein